MYNVLWEYFDPTNDVETFLLMSTKVIKYEWETWFISKITRQTCFEIKKFREKINY